MKACKLPRPHHPCRKGHAHMTLRRHALLRPFHPSGDGQRSPADAPSRFASPALSAQGRARSHDVAYYASPHLLRSCGKGWKRCSGCGMLPPALSKQERTRSHAPAPSRFVPRSIQVVKDCVHRLLHHHTLPRPFRPGRVRQESIPADAWMLLRVLPKQERTRSHVPAPSRLVPRSVQAGKDIFTACCVLRLIPPAPLVCAGQRSPAVALSHVTSSAPPERGRAWGRPAARHIQSPRLLRGLCEILFNFSPGVRLPHPVKIISIIGRSNLV